MFPEQEVHNEINKLLTAKAIQQNHIQTKILNANSEVFATFFHENIIFCIENPIS